VFLFLLSAIGGIFYFVFISEQFQIKKVNISGLEAVSEEQVLNTVNNIMGEKKIGFLKSKNYFIFPVEKLRASLFEAFPKIGEISIQKIHPDGVKIIVEERDVVGVVCKGQNCFYFDKKGVIFEVSPRTSGSIIIAVQDNRDINYELGHRVLSESQITFFKEAQGLLNRNFPFTVREFLITKKGEFEIITSEEWRALLDKNEGLEYQLSSLKYVLDEEIKTRRRELEYVDLRLGNKVYYKYIENSY